MFESLDLEAVKESADLLAIVERDAFLKRKGSKEFSGPCPLCHAAKNDGFVVQPENKRWLCRKCTGGKWRSVIDYIALRDGLDPHDQEGLKEICRRAIDGDIPTTTSARHARYIQPAAAAPAGNWQTAAQRFTDESEHALWAPGGARALAYLKEKRGLQEETIRRYRLGYNSKTVWAPADPWGLPGDSDKPIFLPRGITIPCIVRSAIWYLKIRQPTGDPKYIQPRGSRPAIFGADDLVGADLAIFCEGEIDAMTLHQAIGDFAACATLGASTNLPDLAMWGPYLRGDKDFLEVFDNDSAGQQGAGRLALMVRKIKRCNLPVGLKDINEFYTSGGDLYSWIRPYLPQVPDGWETWLQEVGGCFRDYGAEMFSFAEWIGSGNDDKKFARAWARAMILMGEDPHHWATWAQEDYQVPTSEILEFAERMRA